MSQNYLWKGHIMEQNTEYRHRMRSSLCYFARPTFPENRGEWVDSGVISLYQSYCKWPHNRLPLKTIKSIIACFTRVEPVSIFFWSAEVSSAAMKSMTHYWAIQSHFQECVILVTVLGWGSWLRCFQNHLCDPLFFTVAKHTISVWHMSLTSNNGLIFPNNLPRDLRGAAWIVYPAQTKRVTQLGSVFSLGIIIIIIIISFTFCDVFTCTGCEWFNLFPYVLKGGP